MKTLSAREQQQQHMKTHPASKSSSRFKTSFGLSLEGPGQAPRHGFPLPGGPVKFDSILGLHPRCRVLFRLRSFCTDNDDD